MTSFSSNLENEPLMTSFSSNSEYNNSKNPTILTDEEKLQQELEKLQDEELITSLLNEGISIKTLNTYLNNPNININDINLTNSQSSEISTETLKIVQEQVKKLSSS